MVGSSEGVGGAQEARLELARYFIRPAPQLADDEAKRRDPGKMDKQELKFYLDELNEQMDLAARNLEFELAARLRDRISEIKQISKLKGKKT